MTSLYQNTCSTVLHDGSVLARARIAPLRSTAAASHDKITKKNKQQATTTMRFSEGFSFRSLLMALALLSLFVLVVGTEVSLGYSFKEFTSMHLLTPFAVRTMR
jgi:uncharacterized ion transporter superfamily protein YfcC